eukprot:7153311-Prymnesium_polylepis.1
MERRRMPGRGSRLDRDERGLEQTVLSELSTSLRGARQRMPHRHPTTRTPGAHSDDELDRRLVSKLEAPRLRPLRTRQVPTPGGDRSTEGLSAFWIDNFLTPEECRELITESERCGYEPATVNRGNGRHVEDREQRRSSRCMVDSPAVARMLFERLEPHFPLHGPRGGWRRCSGLNERLRFLRYDPGDYFKPHQDGRYVRPDGHPRAGDSSLMTLMLYLNTPECGGETNFLALRGGQRSTVAPTTGLALCFDHDLLHEGTPLVRGQKYCVRTDVMYTRRTQDSIKGGVTS